MFWQKWKVSAAPFVRIFVTFDGKFNHFLIDLVARLFPQPSENPLKSGVPEELFRGDNGI